MHKVGPVMYRRAGLAILAISLAPVLVSCGGTQSAAAYRASLDKDCAAGLAFSKSLPRKELDQHLTVTEVRALGKKQEAKFRTQLAHLSPPARLASANHRLMADLKDAPRVIQSAAQFNQYEDKLLAVYKALGASGCAADTRETIASLPK